MNEPPRVLLVASSKMQRTPAFERAVALTRAFGAGLRIVAMDYIKSLEVLGMFDRDALTVLRDSYLQTHRRWLEEEAAYERARGLDCSVHVLWTDRFIDEIREYVSAIQPIMVIKDVYHETILTRIFSTPLDWHLLRDCQCPVQFVADARHALPRKVLAAVNLYRIEDADLRLNDIILDAAGDLGKRCGASVHALYSYDWSAIYAAGITMLGAMPIETGFQEALGDAHEEAFADLCERHGIPGNHRHFLTGTPQPVINSFARQNDFDLLVMGTLPRHHLERIMGDTAESILAHAPCSVLIVKPDAAASASRF